MEVKHETEISIPVIAKTGVTISIIVETGITIVAVPTIGAEKLLLGRPWIGSLLDSAGIPVGLTE